METPRPHDHTDRPAYAGGGETAAADEALNEYRWQRRHNIKYDTELSAIYHRRRERFFETIDKTAKALALVGASAAFTKVFGPETLAIAAAIIAVPTTIALVWGVSERAIRHALLARDYRNLLADIEEMGEIEFTDADLDKWRARFLRLESGEPRQLSAVVILSQNEIASRSRCEQTPLTLVQRLFAHVLDFTQLTSQKQPS